METYNDPVAYPATERQKASWKEYQDSGKRMILNIGDVINIKDADVPSIEKAVRSLSDRHESIRTIFALRKEGLVQVIYSPSAFKVDIEQVYCKQRLFSGYKMRNAIEKVLYTPFDLEKGPLVRFALIHTGNNRARFVYAMQHIISDAKSMQIFRNDFWDYYHSFVSGKPVRKAALSFQMKDFAHWEQNYINTKEGKRNLDYWDKMLNAHSAGFQLNSSWLRTGKLNAFRKKGNGGEYTGAISGPFLDEIKSFVSARKTSRLCLFYIALASLFYYLSDQKEIIVIVPITLRDRPGLSEVIGYLNTDVYLKMEVDVSLPLKDMIAIASERYFEAIDHRHHQIEQVIERGHQYCAAVINELPSREEAISDWEAKFITKSIRREIIFPFFFLFTEYTNGLRISCVYSNKAIDNSKLPVLFQKYVDLLQLMTRNPCESIGNLLSLLG